MKDLKDKKNKKEPTTEPITEPKEPTEPTTEPQNEPTVDYNKMFDEMLKDKESEVFKAFNNAVKTEVEKRIAGTTPKTSTTVNTELENFKNMSYKERLELSKTDIDAYNKLSQLERSL